MADLQIGDSIRNPNAPVDVMGARPTIPQFRTQPVQPQGGSPTQPDQGGLINLFKSWFHRQEDLDNIQRQLPGIPGVNGTIVPNSMPATPVDPHGTNNGLRRGALDYMQPEMAGVRG